VLSTGSKIWLSFEPVDMRLSFDGLAGKVAHALGRDPYSGECFVFRSKSGSLRIMFSLVLEHPPHRALTNFRGKPL
jgi:transposase